MLAIVTARQSNGSEVILYRDCDDPTITMSGDDSVYLSQIGGTIVTTGPGNITTSDPTMVISVPDFLTQYGATG